VDALLAGFSGILQSDGYAACENYVRKHNNVVLIACWAHALCKFRDAEGEESPYSQWMQQHIGQLYAWERRSDKFTKPKAQTRKRLRQKYSLPQAHRIKQKLDALSADFSVHGEKFNQAIKYAINRWSALLECLKHGHTRLDTNELKTAFDPLRLVKRTGCLADILRLAKKVLSFTPSWPIAETAIPALWLTTRVANRVGSSGYGSHRRNH